MYKNTKQYNRSTQTKFQYKIYQKNININHTTTTHYNTHGTAHNRILTKSPHPTRSNTTKVCSYIARRTNAKNDKCISNKISASRNNINFLLQHNNNKNNDTNFNIEPPNNTCKQIPTVYIESKFHTKTTITENNSLYNTLTNDIISDSRNNNNRKEYGITDPQLIKDTNNEGTRATNKNINYNKETIPTSNDYPYESKQKL